MKSFIKFGLVISIILMAGNLAQANYDYSTGRWLQRDPIGYDDGMNLYEYGASAPISYRDPFGLFIRECLCVVKRVEMSYGHEWIVCGGTSWGFWPPGLKNPDIYESDPNNLKDKPYSITEVLRKPAEKLEFGSKKGTCCKNATCADIINCIQSYSAYADKTCDWNMILIDPWKKHYTCRTFVWEALDKCCLKKGIVRINAIGKLPKKPKPNALPSVF